VKKWKLSKEESKPYLSTLTSDIDIEGTNKLFVENFKICDVKVKAEFKEENKSLEEQEELLENELERNDIQMERAKQVLLEINKSKGYIEKLLIDLNKLIQNKEKEIKDNPPDWASAVGRRSPSAQPTHSRTPWPTRPPPLPVT